MAGRIVTKNQSMAQVRLDNGERVLISFTTSEVAIFKLIFRGFIPIYKIWRLGIDAYLERISFSANPVEDMADAIIACHSTDEIPQAVQKYLGRI